MTVTPWDEAEPLTAVRSLPVPPDDGADLWDADDDGPGPIESGLSAEGSAKLVKLRASRLSVAQLRALPPPEPLIDGVLFRRSSAVLYGPPGVGKSFIALDWALSIATGNAWLGHAVTRGSVLYVSAEGTEGLAARVDAWKKEHHVYADPGDFTVLPQRIDITNPDDRVVLYALCERERPALVVIDTLARCLAGSDENSSTTMGDATELESRLRQLGVTVLFVHHSTKDKSGGPRGHGSLLGAMDTCCLADGDARALTLKCTKQKNAAEFLPLSLTVAPVAGSCVVRRLTGRETDEDRDARMNETLGIFREMFSETGASGSEFKAALEAETGRARATVNRDVNDLLAAGWLTNVGTDKVHRYRLGRVPAAFVAK